MKILVTFCLLMAFGALAPAFGQAPLAAPHLHSLSLHVEPVSTGGTTQISDGTHDQHINGNEGTGVKTHEEFHTHQTETTKDSETVQVSVRNFSPQPDTAQIEWYFVAAPEKQSASSQLFIYDKGSKTVTIAPGATATFPVTSAPLTSQIKRKDDEHRGKHGSFKSEKSGRAKEQGSEMAGWMARVVADGKTVDSLASKDQLTDIIKDDAKLGGMKGH